MKTIKKIFNVILIFAVIQIFGIVFVSNETYATGFFEKAFESGKEWKTMGGSNSNAIIQNANGLFQATDEIYDTVRVAALSQGKSEEVADKLALGQGKLLLKMGVNGADAGECEIVVTKMVLSIA